MANFEKWHFKKRMITWQIHCALQRRIISQFPENLIWDSLTHIKHLYHLLIALRSAYTKILVDDVRSAITALEIPNYSAYTVFIFYHVAQPTWVVCLEWNSIWIRSLEGWWSRISRDYSWLLDPWFWVFHASSKYLTRLFHTKSKNNQ